MRSLLIVALMACRSYGDSRIVQASESACLCPCACPAPDASVVDAQIDAAPQIDLNTPWTRTTLVPSSSLLKGADGVSRDAEGCLITPWETSNSVTRHCSNGDETVATGISAPEDAEPADIDQDGTIDVVTAADAGAKVHVTFRGSPNTTIALTASQGHGRVMQVAPADVDADGDLDVFMGTRVGTPAVVAWLENPGPDLARLSVHWTYHQISAAGWVMSLVPGDFNGDLRMDVLVSDRTKVGTADWSLFGSRWLEQPSAGPNQPWINHPISQPAGSCSPYASPTCTKTPGDEMFASVQGDTVYDCTSLGSQTDSRIMIHQTQDWLTWTHTLVPAVPNVGHCQSVTPADLDQDGDTDLVVTSWKANSFPTPPAEAPKSGVYWLRNGGDGTYARGEISGPEGAKYDDVLIDDDGCILTTEQLDPMNGFGLVRFCKP